MSCVNDKDLKILMSEDMKEVTDKMVFEGVTPKSYMRKVKAMKKLWRSDSFQMLKAILKEQPIKEGRARLSLLESKEVEDEDDIDTDASARLSAAERAKKLKEADYLKKKDDLIKVFHDALCQDIELLKNQTEENIKESLEKARKMVETVEEGFLEDSIKEKVKEMIQNIKNFRTQKELSLKILVEEDRKSLTVDLQDNLNREIDNRMLTYEKLLDKSYGFKLRRLALSKEEEYEDTARQIIWSYYHKFQRAKNKLLSKQKDKLEKLQCRLEAEYVEAKKWSDNRVDAAVEEAIKEMEAMNESLEKDNDTESTCSIVLGLEDKILQSGWLKWFPRTEEEWESLAEEMLNKFHAFINLILGGKKRMEGECLLSLEKLKNFKNKIAKVTEQRLLEVNEARTERKKHLQATTRAASLINFLVRDVLPSPLPSRTSYSELVLDKVIKCKKHGEARFSGSADQSGVVDTVKFEKMSKRFDSGRISRFTQDTQKLYSEALAKIHSPDTIRSYIDIARDNPSLFNLVFSNV